MVGTQHQACFQDFIEGWGAKDPNSDVPGDASNFRNPPHSKGAKMKPEGEHSVPL
jgi:hypothetical protein